MKLTSVFASFGAILIASASVASAGVLPTTSSSQDISSDAELYDCHDESCNSSWGLEIRGNQPSRPGGPKKPKPQKPNKLHKPQPTSKSQKPNKLQKTQPTSKPQKPNKLQKPRPQKLSTTAKSSITGLPKTPIKTPPGIDGPLEKKFWQDVQNRLKSAAFRGLISTDEMTLYTGGKAWEHITSFENAFETAFPGRTIRHYVNVIKSDAVIQPMTLAYKANPAGRSFVDATGKKPQFRTLPNAIVSYALVMLTRNRPKPVHLFLSSTEDAQAAAKGIIPKGHLKYFEIFPLTSTGSKVTEIFVWDLQTFEANLKKGKDYEPPRIWKNGDLPLGKRIDFSVDSEIRKD